MENNAVPIHKRDSKNLNIFRLGSIRAFWTQNQTRKFDKRFSTISSFYVLKCSNISQSIHYSQKKLKH